MAVSRDRDRRAQELGFRNYLDYRNFLARQEGYRNYYEQRRARSTGSGLKGRDRLRTSIASLSLPPTRPTRLLPAFREVGSLVGRIRLTGADLRAVQQELLELQLSDALGSSAVQRATREITNRIKGDISSLAKDLPGILSGIARDNYRLGSGDREVPLPGEAAELARAAQQAVLSDARRAALGADRSAKLFLPKLLDVQTRREGRGLLRREGIRAVVYANGARRSYEDFLTTSLRANALRVANGSFLAGAASRGITTFRIVDGPDCGLTAHDERPVADGRIVDLETAQAYPLSHPNCVRQFEPAAGQTPTEEPGALRRRIAAGAGATLRASVKASLTATALETAKTFAIQRGLPTRLQEFRTRAIPAAAAYAARLRRLTFPNVFDIRTGRPAKFRVGDLAEDIVTYQDDLAAGRQLPAHVRMMLGVNAEAPRKVVGDSFENFHDYYDNALRANLSVSGGRVVENLITDGFKDGMFGTFYDLVQDRTGGNFVRFSAPRLGGRKGRAKLLGLLPSGRRRPRLTADLFKWARVTRTGGARDAIHHLNLNPNGLLRAGFTRDVAGAITPTLRFVPPGPVRVVTRVNRSRTGAITSLSVELRVITPKSALRRVNEWTGLTNNGQATTFLGRLGLNLGANLNINLRQLGLERLSDIRKLSLEDWLRLRQETYVNPITGKEETHPVIQIVSLATKLRLGRGGLFDLSKTFRIKWEDAVKIWELTSLELRTLDRTQDYLAERRRRRIYKSNTRSA